MHAAGFVLAEGDAADHRVHVRGVRAARAEELEERAVVEAYEHPANVEDNVA